MGNQYTYWQNSETPFFIIRQTSFSKFECYDRITHVWKDYPDGFREVSLSNECHKLSEEDALTIIMRLKSIDTMNMNYKELCALAKLDSK